MGERREEEDRSRVLLSPMVSKRSYRLLFRSLLLLADETIHHGESIMMFGSARNKIEQ